MRKFRVVGLRFVLFGIVWAGIMGAVITGLWNALLPAILNLPRIDFWQALGLFVLSRILFGGFGGWGGRRMGRSRFARGLKDLTPEERERFRNAMGARGGCGFGRRGEAEKV